MSIAFALPATVEADLARELGRDLNNAAREAFILENHRAGHLSVGDVALILGLETRLQAEQWLAQHGAHMNYSFEGYHADCRTLDDLRRADD